MNFEKLKKWTYTITFVLGAGIVSYLFMKHIFVAVLPFLIGWFIAFAIRPPAAYLSRKLKIRADVLRVILTVLSFLIIIAILSVGIWALSREVRHVITRFSEGDGALYDFITSFTGAEGVFGRIFGELGEYVAEGIYKLAISLLTTVAGAVSTFAVFVPKALFFILITVIASVYFAYDLERINAGVKSIMPDKVRELIIKLKNGFLSAFIRYIRSYLILLVITFVEMLLGLFVLRAPYPLIMAGVIAVLDLLPVIGVGTVLIPWGVWAFISGNSGFGIGILVLFVIHVVFRQTIEPKIVGKNLGVHPILTLVFIYTGYSLFGFIGLILIPIFTVLVNIAFGKKDATEVDKGRVGK